MLQREVAVSKYLLVAFQLNLSIWQLCNTVLQLCRKKALSWNARNVWMQAWYNILKIRQTHSPLTLFAWEISRLNSFNNTDIPDPLTNTHNQLTGGWSHFWLPFLVTISTTGNICNTFDCLNRIKMMKGQGFFSL